MLNYVVVPASVLVELRGKAMALQVFCCLTVHRNTRTNRTHFMSKAMIADFTGISKRHIYNILPLLEAKDIIEVVAERRGEYMWFIPSLASAESSEEDLRARTAEMLQQMGVANE